MTAPSRVLFRCDGATIPPRLADRGGTEILPLRSRGDDLELELQLQSLGSVLHKSEIDPRSADLVRLAAYVYRADTMVSRGSDRDVHGAHWKRNLALCAPVSDPAVWSRPAVVKRLRAAVEFATGDTWEFAFVGGGAPPPPIPVLVEGREVYGTPTVVSLFSGGVDSLCALLESAARHERPVAVGHWSTDPHKARQRDLVHAADLARVGGWNFPLVGLRIHRRGPQWADNSQRSRAFLYAALGAAVAAEVGAAKVYLADNGPVSINLPTNDQLVGTLASRSTHPKFLHLVNRFLEALLPMPVTVSNPLADRTRAEAMRVLASTGCTHLLPMTLSCSAWRGLSSRTPHCGTCFQCIDRRVAGIAADLSSFDPGSSYKVDVFTADLDRWRARTAAEAYVRFAQRVPRMDNAEVFRTFPQLRDVVVRGDQDPDQTILDAIDLVRRQAAMARTALSAMLDLYRDDYFDGTLPASCLLRLAGDDLVAGTPDAERRSSDDVAPGAEANVFACQGDTWLVRYGGTSKTVTNGKGKGLRTIALLLQHPRTSYTAAEIEARLGVVDPDLMRGDPTHEFHDVGFGGGGTVADDKAIRAYRDALSDLDEEIDEARTNNDLARVALLKEQKSAYLDEIKRGTKPGGALQPFADDLSRQRERVLKSIRRTIARIAKHHPAAAEHLTASIRRGSDLAYAPEPPVSWEFEAPQP